MDGARKEANGSHVPEVDIGIEDAFDLPIHLAAEEDEAAGETWSCAASTRIT